jgi:peptidoglycan/xylan/chitin deacetylase (PgdA/CDA1 family)
VPRALILTYHAIEPGPSPLCVDPTLFESHLDQIVSSGVRAVTVSELAERLDEPTESMVALTFDDGFASVATSAAPLLHERGLSGTVYCVAGHLNGRSSWPSARPGGWESSLLSADQIRALHAAGIEIGSHGFTHAPLTVARGEELHREVVGSKEVLEGLIEAPVSSFALPYGAPPSDAARLLLERSYATVCTTRLARVESLPELHSLPRVDAHYLRRPQLLGRALEGSLDPYLAVRRLGSKARRVLRKDYASVND